MRWTAHVESRDEERARLRRYVDAFDHAAARRHKGGRWRAIMRAKGYTDARNRRFVRDVAEWRRKAA